MSHDVRLSDEVYARVEEAAAASGRSVEEMISVLFPPTPNQTGLNGSTSHRGGPNGSIASAAEHAPRSMADVLAPYLGTFASGGLDAIAARPGDPFSDHLIEKKRNGTL